VGAGVKPQTAALVTLGAGALGAYALKGPAKVAAMGAAALAGGQIALAWQVKRQAEQAAKKKEEEEKKQAEQVQGAQVAQAPGPEVPKRNAADGFDDDEHDGYDDVRNAGEVEEYAADYDEAA
jgi:hypothetical protein